MQRRAGRAWRRGHSGACPWRGVFVWRLGCDAGEHVELQGGENDAAFLEGEDFSLRSSGSIPAASRARRAASIRSRLPVISVLRATTSVRTSRATGVF